MTTEQRNTHIYIYNLFKITASTNVTEPNPKMIKYPIETDNFLSNELSKLNNLKLA